MAPFPDLVYGSVEIMINPYHTGILHTNYKPLNTYIGCLGKLGTLFMLKSSAHNVNYVNFAAQSYLSI